MTGSVSPASVDITSQICTPARGLGQQPIYDLGSRVDRENFKPAQHPIRTLGLGRKTELESGHTLRHRDDGLIREGGVGM